MTVFESGALQQEAVDLIDTCFAPGATGKILETFKIDACPKNETTNTYPDACDVKTKLSLYEVFVGKIIGQVDNQFDNIQAPEGLPKVVENPGLLMLGDILKI